MADGNARREARGLAVRWTFALTALAVLAVASHVVLVGEMSTMENDGRLINMAGRQRMLLPRMALLTRVAMREGDVEERKAMAAQIDDSAAEMLATQQRLRRAMGAGGRWQMPAGLNAQVDTLARSMQALAAVAAAGLPIDPTEGRRLAAAGEDVELVRGLDSVASLFERRHAAHLRTAHAWQRWLLGAQAAVIALLGLGIAVPVVRRIRREIAARDQANARLRERTAEIEASRAEALRTMAEVERGRQEVAALAEELRRSNKELEQFAYVASHDLQEPLRMVASYVELLRRRYASRLDADADEFIDYAVDGARRMQTLIADLLAYSRVGRGAVELQPVSLQEALDEVLADVQVAVRESGAAVTADPLPTVLGDPRGLRQLLQNLLGNALKFHGEGPPRVHVGARWHDGCWEITVRDQGIGIDPRHADRIFELFQRLHARRDFPGTGIGLAICKKIVELHGGRIHVASTPGRGAAFTFTLPAPAPLPAPVDTEGADRSSGEMPAQTGP